MDYLPGYVSSSEKSQEWGLSSRRVRALCDSGRIGGAIKIGSSWLIPENESKPQDSRYRNRKKKDMPLYMGGGSMVDIKEILTQKEGMRLEVKSAKGGLPKSIWETYSAFANTFGGYIVLGIEEENRTHKLIPAGVDDPGKLISEIWSVLNNKAKVSLNLLSENQVYALRYENMDFVVIEVPRASRENRPIYIGQNMMTGSYKRNGDGDYQCREEEIKSFLRDQKDGGADSLLLVERSLDSLCFETVKKYRNIYASIHPSHVWNSLSDEVFLMKIGACRISNEDGKTHPTLGGLIFFGNHEDIIDELPNYFLDYQERDDSSIRWSNRLCSGNGEWSGNVFDFYFLVINKLVSDFKTPFSLKNGLFRDDDTSMKKAVREALANTLSHADYYGRRGIVIIKKKDGLSFSNPGGFRIELEEAKEGGVSDSRNPKIFNMFAQINIGDRSGQGICTMLSLWEENGYLSPSYDERVDPSRVTLFLPLRKEAEEKNEKESIEEQIIELVKESPSISKAQIGKSLGVSRETVKYYVRKLIANNRLNREGDNKRGKWIIVEK